MRIIVLAKAPVAGLSKTRLQTRWSPDQAAALAEAALLDTLATVAAVPRVRRELVLDGDPGGWVPEGFTVRPQASGDLATRIHAALVEADAPTLLIGMDTPQATVADLTRGLAHLRTHAATIGLAADGGWWALGLANPCQHGDLVLGIPTSTERTGALQVAALEHLSVARLPTLRDVDTPADADAVAALIPASRFGSLVAALTRAAA